MLVWVGLLLSTLAAAAWRSPFEGATRPRDVQRKPLPNRSYTKDELRVMADKLQPKSDGPILTATIPETGGGFVEKGVRIVNGKGGTRGQHPWQVGIIINEENFCGGALVTNSYVLTAAHCLDGASTFAVILGAQNRSAFEPGRMMIETNRVIIHPKWNRDLVIHDIALLPLPYPVPETSLIKPIRLPRKASVNSKFEGSNVTACGWGKTADEDTGPTGNMNCARLKILSNTECAKVYGTDSFKNSNLCAMGYNEMSICNGDSGGPLIMQEKDKSWTLLGLVSYGAAASCQVGYPDVFTRATSYLSWITNNTGASIRA